MEPESQESSIERLKRTLYSRNENIVPKEKRTPVTERSYDVPTSWGDKPSFDISPEVMIRRNNKFFNRFLIISVTFFVISLAVALFIFFGGLNMISSNNLDIKVTAPSSISSGEELQMGLSIINTNRTNLENVVLYIEYPEGAQSLVDEGKVLTREDVSLGTVEKGKSKDYSIRALLFGEKDAVKEFTFKLEYKVNGSNATFSKEKKHQVVVSSSPILLKVNYPQEVNSGQEMVLSIEATSNSNVVMKNTMIKVEYPYGFTYKDSNIKPVRDDSIWNIGDLKNGDKKTLTITGVLVGQNLEDRSFRVSTGVQSLDNSKDFDTTLAATSITVGIRKSFFDLVVDSTPDGVMRIGQEVPVRIKWENTLPDKVLSARIEATVSGSAYNKSGVSPDNGGFFRSLDDTILWDKNTTGNLDTLLPGESGEVTVYLSSFSDPVQIRSIKNPHIDVRVKMIGERSGSEAETISSVTDITIKLASTLSVTGKTYRNVGPFTNTGSIPPRADNESTYTINWLITNTTNDLKDAVISAELPPGVEWKGETSPAGERVSYNPDTKVVTWNAGNVVSGTGFAYSPRQAFFKVGIIPSLNQVGKVAPLVIPMNASSVDTYTNTTVTAIMQQLTTQYSDPGFKQGDEVVKN